MNVNPRQLALIKEVQRLQSVSLERLAEHFGVALQTVRRDVRLLCEAGQLTRFHGGVRAASSTIENVAYRQRQLVNNAAKQAIAQTVAKHIPNGCSIIINIGTTAEAIARALLSHQGLRVITNNLNVAAILADNAQCEVIVAGGVVRTLDRGIVGEATVDFMAQFKVDIGLIGISAIEADGTLRDFDYREVKVAQTIMNHSREVWLAADHSKFNRPAMVELGRLDQVDRLFTDQTPPEPFPGLLDQAGVGCMICH
jgi:DeoR family transcriptional regulator, glycerol-3-phosphate regulon repressor